MGLPVPTGQTPQVERQAAEDREHGRRIGNVVAQSTGFARLLPAPDALTV
jgi:hypothetical protein